ELDNCPYFYVLNHKKYCYMDNEGIQVRSGGIPHDSFNRDMSFKEFVDTQFSDGVEIETKKSIYNNEETISIRSEEHTSELQSRFDLVCRLLLEKKKKN